MLMLDYGVKFLVFWYDGNEPLETSKCPSCKYSRQSVPLSVLFCGHYILIVCHMISSKFHNVHFF